MVDMSSSQNVNGSHEIDNESQASQLSDTALHQQTIDILVEEKAELLKTRDKQNSNIQQLKGLCLLCVATCSYVSFLQEHGIRVCMIISMKCIP